jgi:hypothetical protein
LQTGQAFCSILEDAIQRLDEQVMEVINVPGDGNCFFHAVCDQLRGTALDMSHNELRQLVAAEAADEIRNLYQQGIISDCPEQLLQITATHNVAVPDEIPPLVSSILGVELVIYRRDGSIVQRVTPNYGPAAAIVRVMLEAEHYRSVLVLPRDVTNCASLPHRPQADSELMPPPPSAPEQQRKRGRPKGSVKPEACKPVRQSARLSNVDLDAESDDMPDQDVQPSPVKRNRLAQTARQQKQKLMQSVEQPQQVECSPSKRPRTLLTVSAGEARRSMRFHPQMETCTVENTQSETRTATQKQAESGVTEQQQEGDQRLPECLQNPFCDKFLRMRNEFTKCVFQYFT